MSTTEPTSEQKGQSNNNDTIRKETIKTKLPQKRNLCFHFCLEIWQIDNQRIDKEQIIRFQRHRMPF